MTENHASYAVSATRLGWATAINAGFAVVQVLVGLAIGSVVVLADAAHQTVDAIGLVTALIALRLARRPASSEYSYGMRKADALGGLVSGVILLGSVAWITVEAVRRLLDPEPVAGGGVIAIGLVAIAVNGVGVLLVGHQHGDDALSMRAARLHLLADLAGSFVVVAAGLAIVWTDVEWIDPAASLVVSALVVWSTLRLLRAAAQVLLDRVPRGVSTADVARALRAQPGVQRVHHVHVRPLGGGEISASAHVVVDGSRSVHDAQATADRLSRVLASEHAIGHTTLQLECHPCDEVVGEH